LAQIQSGPVPRRAITTNSFLSESQSIYKKHQSE
jgi:hypothetical protein